jgi:very-long-chain ceramide synthase
MWFVMIINVAIKVVKGGMAEDTRSEDESDKAGSDIDREAEELRQHFDEQILLVKEQVAGAISPKGRKSSLSKPHRTTISSSTGVSFPGKGGRKELLGRIGCDKDA